MNSAPGKYPKTILTAPKQDDPKFRPLFPIIYNDEYIFNAVIKLSNVYNG
jgi:hypothetical protein